MRDTVTLLELLKKEIECNSISWQKSGCLCIMMSYMLNNSLYNVVNQITYEEYRFLSKYITENKPETGELDVKARTMGYWFDQFDSESRVEYLDNLINYEYDVLKDRRV